MEVQKMKYCLQCNKQLTTDQRHNIYCSQQCANIAKRENKIKQWLDGEYDGIIGENQLSSVIRNFLLEKANYQCELCGWNKINPITNKCPLEIHHKDGNYLNNQKDNLQVLCPNCHSLTENYKALNKNGRENRITIRKKYCLDCGKEICQTSLRCRDCAAKQQITEKPLTREELKEKIRILPFTQIAKEQNVSDNAIRKWCISYNLPSRKKDINSYSDEDWKKI